MAIKRVSPGEVRGHSGKKFRQCSLDDTALSDRDETRDKVLAVDFESATLELPVAGQDKVRDVGPEVDAVSPRPSPTWGRCSAARAIPPPSAVTSATAGALEGSMETGIKAQMPANVLDTEHLTLEETIAEASPTTALFEALTADFPFGLLTEETGEFPPVAEVVASTTNIGAFGFPPEELVLLSSEVLVDDLEGRVCAAELAVADEFGTGGFPDCDPWLAGEVENLDPEVVQALDQRNESQKVCSPVAADSVREDLSQELPPEQMTPPPNCSPSQSPASLPPTPVGCQCLIREGSNRADFLKYFATGETFNSAYEVGRKIGEGGFGNVFVAKHRILGLERAVKRLSKSHGKAESHQNELQALFALDHPHIVKLVEYYDEDRYLYLVFEFCQGPDLFDRVASEESGRMSEFDASVALRHILKGLQCCHAKYRGHFDVKPENFMYTNRDLTELKMIDLGMSSGYGLHRRRAKIRGTAAYMAPEVWRGIYGPEADLWSVGIVLFVMLTGEPALPECALEAATMKNECKLTELIKRRLKYATGTCALSAVALDLLHQLLQHDRHGRPTVREALKHPFCTLSYESESVLPSRIHDIVFQEAQAILRNLLDTFRAMAEEPMLKRVARLVMAHTSEPVASQHLAFRMLDWHGYGELSVAVLEKDLEQRGVEVPSNMDHFFEVVDVFREGYISYLGFLAVTLSSDVMRDDILCGVTFGVLDRNKDGFIDTSDLARVFGNEHVCRSVLQEVSFDTRLSSSAFLQMMREDVCQIRQPLGSHF